MTKILSSQLEPEMIIGRALKQGETLVPLRNLISIIHSEVEAEAVGYFILNSCYTKNYKESLLTYEDDVDDKKRLEALRHGPAKRVPWRNNICLARIDSNYYPSDGIHVVYIKDTESVLIAGSKNYEDSETFTEIEESDELPEVWANKGICPKLYTYGDAFVFLNNRPDIVNTSFLLRALTSEEVYGQLMRIDKSTPSKSYCFTEEEFLSLMIPMPSLEEQLFLIGMDYGDALDCKSIVDKYLYERIKHVVLEDARGELVSLLYRNAGGDDKKVLGILPVFCQEILTEREMLFLKHFAKEALDFIFAPRNIAIAIRDDSTYASRELSDFLFGLLDVDADDTVYNPFANNGSLACHNAFFEGEEMDEMDWAMAKARLHIAGVKNNITNGNPFVDNGKKYGFIICMPEPGMQRECSYDRILEMLYDKLEFGGGLVYCVPSLNFLRANDRQTGIRKRLINEGALLSVYVLPAEKGGVTRVALHIMKEAGKCIDNDSVFLYDYSKAKHIADKGGETEISFEIDTPVGDCFDTEKNDKFFVEVPYEQIKERSNSEYYELNPLVYMTEIRIRKRMPEANFVRLGDLVEPIVGTRTNAPVRILDNKAFYEAGAGFERDFAKLPVEMPSRVCALLECDALLIPRHVIGLGDRLKAFYYVRKSNCPVAYYRDSVAAFRVKMEGVSGEFLASEFSGSNYISEQLNSYSVGNILHIVPVDNLLNVLVDVPSKERQNERIGEHKVAELDRLLGEKGREIKMQHEDFVRRVRSRKHAIGNVMGEVVPAFDGLVDCFNEHGGKLTESDLVWKGFDDTVGSVIAKLQKEICRVAEMVSNMTNAVDVEFGTPDEFVAKDLVEDYISSHVFNRCTVRMNYSEEAFAEVLGERNEIAIKVCKDDFNKILDNIVINAVKHGFTEEGKTYYIEFDVAPTIINGCLAVGISVRNNGNPLPKGMTVEKVFQEGQSTSGSFGIGGWFIKSAVEQFGGEVDMNLFDPEENDFSIEYVLKFPISNL